VAILEASQIGRIGDGATTFLSKLKAEVEWFRNSANVLRQVCPILSRLATEVKKILELRPRTDQLEADVHSIASHAGSLDVGVHARLLG
jgi:hypothetical protein